MKMSLNRGQHTNDYISPERMSTSHSAAFIIGTVLEMMQASDNSLAFYKGMVELASVNLVSNQMAVYPLVTDLAIDKLAKRLPLDVLVMLT
ncbi:hypothetical protein GL272_01755 [Aeromonas veronii]|uniref:hypothetical protein n=1 Tax=Aeromonas veronii TaxID=654 RepID=UPI001C5AFE10|nr:hypothetical protein [Aeromonas veronii]MBW3775678.1 hypothetical protein [Aeromonas veronii]